MAGSNPLEGVAALTKQLVALGKLDDGKALKRAVKKGIQPALVTARNTIPVGRVAHRAKLKGDPGGGLLVAPGFAKSQLRTISTINAQKNVASGLLGVRKRAYYALQFVELGTSKQRPQPFLRNALLSSRDDCESALKTSLQTDVLKAAATK